MSDYINSIPINCKHMVLDLLYDDRWEYRIERRLYLSRSRPPYVRVYWSENRCWDFLVAAGLGERMLEEYLLQGTPHWGYTDNKDLTISDHGRTTMRDLYGSLGTPYSFGEFRHRLRTERWLREG